jgi:hypothetical protein
VASNQLLCSGPDSTADRYWESVAYTPVPPRRSHDELFLIDFNSDQGVGAAL